MWIRPTKAPAASRAGPLLLRRCSGAAFARLAIAPTSTYDAFTTGNDQRRWLRDRSRSRLNPGAGAGMAKKPESPNPVSWDLYKIAKEGVWLSTVEAPDTQSAIEKAAAEFKVDTWRLYAMERR
jgi:hypothetical protein